jgi:hypothetical protein
MPRRIVSASGHMRECIDVVEEQLAEMKFVLAWHDLAEDGEADAYGSREFRLVFEKWHEDGMAGGHRQFIRDALLTLFPGVTRAEVKPDATR